MSLPKTPAIAVKSPIGGEKKQKDNPFDAKQPTKVSMTPQPTNFASKQKMLNHKDDLQKPYHSSLQAAARPSPALSVLQTKEQRPSQNSVNSPPPQSTITQAPEKQKDIANATPQVSKDKALISGIERLISRKIEVGVHIIKQLTCKSEIASKSEVPESKKQKLDQQRQIKQQLKTQFDREKVELLEYIRSREKCASIVETHHKRIEDEQTEVERILYGKMYNYHYLSPNNRRASFTGARKNDSPNTPTSSDYPTVNAPPIGYRELQKIKETFQQKDRTNLLQRTLQAIEQQKKFNEKAEDPKFQQKLAQRLKMSVGGIEGSFDTNQIINQRKILNNTVIKDYQDISLNNTSLHVKLLDHSIQSELAKRPSNNNEHDQESVEPNSQHENIRIRQRKIKTAHPSNTRAPIETATQQEREEEVEDVKEDAAQGSEEDKKTEDYGSQYTDEKNDEDDQQPKSPTFNGSLNVKGDFKREITISRKKHGSDIQEEPDLEEIEDVDENFDSPEKAAMLTKIPYQNQESAISFKATSSNNRKKIETQLAIAINESFGPGGLLTPERDNQVPIKVLIPDQDHRDQRQKLQSFDNQSQNNLDNFETISVSTGIGKPIHGTNRGSKSSKRDQQFSGGANLGNQVPMFRDLALLMKNEVMRLQNMENLQHQHHPPRRSALGGNLQTGLFGRTTSKDKNQVLPQSSQPQQLETSTNNIFMHIPNFLGTVVKQEVMNSMKTIYSNVNVEEFLSIIDLFQRMQEHIIQTKAALQIHLHFGGQRSKPQNSANKSQHTNDASTSERHSPKSQISGNEVASQALQLVNELEQKKQQCINLWSNLIEIATGKFWGGQEDFLVSYNAKKIEADIYLEFKDFHNAIQKYKKLKSFCDDRKRYKEKVVLYGQLGHVYSLLDNHTASLKYFHKQLELAWEQGDERLELQACGFLGMAYYYQGDLERSMHYNDRATRGLIETDNSVIKRVSNNLIQAKRKRPKYEFYLNPNLLAEYIAKKQRQMNGQEEQRIDFGLSKAYQLLPHYFGNIDEEVVKNEGPGEAIKRKMQRWQENLKNMNGPKFVSRELAYLNNPPPYQYLEIKDPLMNKKRPKLLQSGTNDIRSKIKNMTLREYVGEDNLRLDSIEAPSMFSPQNTGKTNKQVGYSRPKRIKDGETIFFEILDRARKQGAMASSSANRAKTAGCINISHQSMLRMYPKRDPVSSPATHAYAMQSLDESIDFFKQLLKRQMLINIRKHKLGLQFEEVCYNI